MLVPTAKALAGGETFKRWGPAGGDQATRTPPSGGILGLVQGLGELVGGSWLSGLDQ